MNDPRRPRLRIFWIGFDAPGRLAVMPRPHPDAFDEIRASGVDTVVSLLEPIEAARVGLSDQAELCRRAGIELLCLPVVDHGVPSAVEPVISMSAEIGRRLALGQGVAVHCFAGLGRSPLLIAAVLIDHGLGARAACDLISAARGVPVPEMPDQSKWLIAYERLRRGL